MWALAGWWHRRGRQYTRLPDIQTPDGPVALYCAEKGPTRDEYGDTMAQVIGDAIYIRSRWAFTPAVKRHELQHIRQARRIGWLFPLLYWLEHRMRGYWNNRYEVAARRAQTRPLARRRIRQRRFWRRVG